MNTTVWTCIALLLPETHLMPELSYNQHSNGLNLNLWIPPPAREVKEDHIEAHTGNGKWEHCDQHGALGHIHHLGFVTMGVENVPTDKKIVTC